MLYDHWRHIADRSSKSIALRDLGTGEAWTFEELLRRTDCDTLIQKPIVFPQGVSADFIFTVLQAWRSNRVVCPVESGQRIPVIREALPEGVIHLKTTSATTGAPRLVAFTEAQLAADARNIVATMGLTLKSPNIGVISLAHSYGFSNLVLPLLLHGIPLILAGSVLPEAIKRSSGMEDAVTLPAVPALWAKWHQADAIPANVCRAISAGAPLPLKLEQEIFEHRGLKVRNFYGSTECGGIAYDRSDVPRKDASFVGTPLENVETGINGDGCLYITSAAVGQTYWPEPAVSLANGRFQTSDLVEIVDGLIYLRGRANDQINVAGRKVLPEAIEGVLAAHPAVRECVIFGVPSSELGRGETIVACLALDQKANADILKQYLLQQLPAWQVPREWWFVDSLTANERGKLSRVEWRKRFLEPTRNH